MTDIHDDNLISELIDQFPFSLTEDKDLEAFVKAFAKQIIKNIALIKCVIIYVNIDNLAEDILDMLAVDLKCDWYDPSQTIDIKRKTIKNCMKIHMYKGTPYAVETAVSNVYEGSTLSEWFEYGGKPYFFRLNLEITKEVGIDIYEKLLRQINYYKNKRSHIEELDINISKAASIYTGTLPQIHNHIKIYAKEE